MKTVVTITTTRDTIPAPAPAATPTRAQADARKAWSIRQNLKRHYGVTLPAGVSVETLANTLEALRKEKQSQQREQQRVKQVAAWKESVRARFRGDVPPNVTPADVRELFGDVLGDIMTAVFKRHGLKV